MKELKQQLASALLVIVTVAAIVAAAINFQQQSRFHLPDDGVTWVDQTVNGAPSDRIVAAYVTPHSPGEKAGIHVGDVLVSIENQRIGRSEDATEILARLGVWSKAEYRILHGGVEVPATVYVAEAGHSSTLYYQYAVGGLYLAIGLFVYFRRGSAPRALHFYLLCLTSFILFTFHYSGTLNAFDKIVYYGNLVAGFLAPTLFLHFCFVFPEPQKWIRRRGSYPLEASSGWALLLYLPGLA